MCECLEARKSKRLRGMESSGVWLEGGGWEGKDGKRRWHREAGPGSHRASREIQKLSLVLCSDLIRPQRGEQLTRNCQLAEETSDQAKSLP